MAATQYRVLLTDCRNSEVSSEIPYLFHKAGALVDVYCSKKSWLRKNSHWDNLIDTNNASPREYVKQLKIFVESGKYDWIVLVDEAATNLVHREMGDDALALKLLPISDLRKREVLGSKAGLSLLCQDQNILTPAFAIYTESFDLSALASKVSYPLLIKVDISKAGYGVFYCDDEIAVRKKLSELTDSQKENLVFQKYIHGETISVEAIYREGELCGYACSKSLRTVGNEFNVTLDRVYLECTKIEDDLQNAGRALSINGFASMTYLLSKEDGLFYLVEADLRANVWFRLAECAGVDFSQAIRNYLSKNGEIVRPHFGVAGDSTPAVASYFSRAIIWALRRGNMAEIIKWVCNVDGRWRCIPLYDSKLFVWNLHAIFRSCLYLALQWFIRFFKHTSKSLT